jgi:hypothetical protein
VVVELEPVSLAEVTALADAKDHRLGVVLKLSEQLGWRRVLEIVGADGALDGLHQAVLANAL